MHYSGFPPKATHFTIPIYPFKTIRNFQAVDYSWTKRKICYPNEFIVNKQCYLWQVTCLEKVCNRLQIPREPSFVTSRKSSVLFVIFVLYQQEACAIDQMNIFRFPLISCFEVNISLLTLPNTVRLIILFHFMPIITSLRLQHSTMNKVRTSYFINTKKVNLFTYHIIL